MTREGKRRAGYILTLSGVTVVLMGASVLVEWLNNDYHWMDGIKGPVWLVVGGCFAVIGRQFIDDARQ